MPSRPHRSRPCIDPGFWALPCSQLVALMSTSNHTPPGAQDQPLQAPMRRRLVLAPQAASNQAACNRAASAPREHRAEVQAGRPAEPVVRVAEHQAARQSLPTRGPLVTRTCSASMTSQASAGSRCGATMWRPEQCGIPPPTSAPAARRLFAPAQNLRKGLLAPDSLHLPRPQMDPFPGVYASTRTIQMFAMRQSRGLYAGALPILQKRRAGIAQAYASVQQRRPPKTPRARLMSSNFSRASTRGTQTRNAFAGRTDGTATTPTPIHARRFHPPQDQCAIRNWIPQLATTSPRNRCAASASARPTERGSVAMPVPTAQNHPPTQTRLASCKRANSASTMSCPSAASACA